MANCRSNTSGDDIARSLEGEASGVALVLRLLLRALPRGLNGEAEGERPMLAPPPAAALAFLRARRSERSWLWRRKISRQLLHKEQGVQEV